MTEIRIDFERADGQTEYNVYTEDGPATQGSIERAVNFLPKAAVVTDITIDNEIDPGTNHD